ncbi:hypothetical protein GCM10027176_37440 [Actinoallomurus bryophytorum]|uniref:Aromatic prenyltransferase Orf2 n=2 Tax=Actinoallomurus bryophytorum TaxID=1490222 RepID=A0A543CJ03_9ACTN|nr:aromatic prenyltransferase [Actinoallomurus bryophytorum]TQL97065.1 aromatic prenyltransferase Orf2 [Actinoallomurus bryophytorum]
MSGAIKLADFYSAIEDTARPLDVPCSRDQVWPILTAFGDGEDALSQSVIAFRVATDIGHDGELDCRFTVPKNVDPYDSALAKGLIEKTDHPVGALLPDVQKLCPIDTYAIDFGVVGGFKKIYAFFPPDDLQDLSELAGIPSMPRGLGEHLGLSDRYGLSNKTGCVAIDYPGRTVNIYYGETFPDGIEREVILSLLRETGQQAPSEQMLRFAQAAFGIYITLSWDSPKIKRVCFAAMTPDPMRLPIPLDPKIEGFVRHMQDTGTEGKFVCGVASSPRGEYYKLQAYYQWRPWMVDLMAHPASV